MIEKTLVARPVKPPPLLCAVTTPPMKSPGASAKRTRKRETLDRAVMVSGDGIVSPAVATYIKIVLLGIGLELPRQSGLSEIIHGLHMQEADGRDVTRSVSLEVAFFRVLPQGGETRKPRPQA